MLYRSQNGQVKTSGLVTQQESKLKSKIVKTAFSFLLSISFLAQQASAVPFYQSKSSPFPSGEASVNALKEKVLRTEHEIQYKVKWQDKEFVRAKNELLFDFELSDQLQTLSNAALRLEPKNTGTLLQILPAGMKLPIIRTQGLWAQVRFQKHQGWIHQKEFQNSPEDQGFFRAAVETPLRIHPRDTAERLTMIPVLGPVRAIKQEKNWIKVQWGKHTGFLNLRHLVGKVDFAERVTLKDGSPEQWEYVRSRNNDHLISSAKKKIPLESIQLVETNRAKAIVVNAANGLPQGTRVDVLGSRGELWIQSQLKGHGAVWWSKAPVAENKIKTSDLLKKYKNKEYPGLTTREGVHFIGQYRSRDGGKNFEPFIRWEEVAGLIRSKYSIEPEFFKITKIEPMKGSQIKITLDVGKTQVKLVSHSLGDEVRVVR